MPDITMCKDKKCKKRNTCMRFTSVPDKYGQSYFVGKVKGKDRCDYYILDVITYLDNEKRNKK
jgi:hypothetical protein